MPTYAAVAMGAVILSTAVIVLVFGRLKLLNGITMVSVTLATLISVAALPFVFGLIVRIRGDSEDPSALMLVLVLTVIFFLILAFIFSIFISTLIPKFAKVSAQAGSEMSEAENQSAAVLNENYLEQIYDKLVHENDREASENGENMDKAENNLEKSVDSSENIDKMGIENIVSNSVVLTIEECIEEAFRRKETGDAEGAIQYFIDALDKNPRKELTFWVVLDICVLYKSLGQVELAYDILNSYYDTFGDIMELSVKEEIENNLFDI